jgi:metallo-beta-lactamase class B
MRAIVLSTCAALFFGMSFIAREPQNSPDPHVALAKEAAGQEFTTLFNALCPATTPAPRGQGAGQRAGQAAARGGQRGTPDRALWHAEPVKVFDNLYYVGMTEYSAWAVVTSAGIIVIDTIYDYSVEDEVIEGLKKLGFDPAQIKYAIVSHAHVDHSGGARILQDRGARIILSAADWDLFERNTAEERRPKRDIVATDGYKLTLGDTTLTLYVTPGHTPGTISTLIPVKDQGRPHLAALWGGTAFNFQQIPSNFESYIDSAKRFGDIVSRTGADIILSNHTNYDGSKVKQPALATRKPGDAHPYVVGNQSVRRFLKVAEECATAGLLRLPK